MCCSFDFDRMLEKVKGCIDFFKCINMINNNYILSFSSIRLNNSEEENRNSGKSK